ncbi:hypothetical protein JZ751_021855 [Albula glossodonta]|uniref:Ependymin n=1 Tax=Albula glossodonta TaxID=121402 RepID=A0A8T2NKE0_9TELE|nr:hypothetical protein JZ751_021855 [Albula glossodonta]
MYPKGQVFAAERFSYDAFGERIRVRAGGIEHNKTFHVDLLMLFREEVMYEISHRNRTCKKMPLKAPFQAIEIPHDATLQAQVIIGSSSGPGQGLLVNNWMGKLPEKKGDYFLTYTEFGCIPITNLYHTTGNGYFLESFWDIVVGIEDPQEFFPPDFCDTSEPMDDEDTVTDFFEALLSMANQ